MELQALIHYLKEQKVEAMRIGYFLHGIMERHGITVIDFKKKVFSLAQSDGCDDNEVDTQQETIDNLQLLGWREDEREVNSASLWWSDFKTVDSNGNEINEEDFQVIMPETFSTNVQEAVEAVIIKGL